MGDSLLLAPLEVEGEDLDAFNDETFGGEAAEWEESGIKGMKIVKCFQIFILRLF